MQHAYCTPTNHDVMATRNDVCTLNVHIVVMVFRRSFLLP